MQQTEFDEEIEEESTSDDEGTGFVSSHMLGDEIIKTPREWSKLTPSSSASSPSATPTETRKAKTKYFAFLSLKFSTTTTSSDNKKIPALKFSQPTNDSRIEELS